MKKGKKAKRIILDDEVITRNEVKQILENTTGDNQKQKSKKRKHTDDETDSFNETKITDKCVDNINTNEEQSDTVIGENQEFANVSDNDIPQQVIKNQESKRSLKRKKHAQLLQEKQLKAILTNQQRCLNYLSLWKLDKSKWKFEKLRQVWLQHNMYDSNKVPDDFFIILIDYFMQSKGKVKEAIVENAIKIVEEQLADSNINDDNRETSSNETKLNRARTVVQTLGV